MSARLDDHSRPARHPKGEALADAPGEAVDLGLLDEFIGFHLRRAQEASFQAYARRVGGSDLHPGRFALLVLISRNTGITPTALSRVAGRDKSSITPALRDLEARGLVGRSPAPGDRRSVVLHLTDAGEARLAQLTVHALAHDAELDRIIGVSAKPAFLRQLRRISEAFA
ncbi:MAG: MarR family transcriptional regulator [Rhodospirillales bacterium]|nr:MarR family transcriptional regulator [Rhodospirillales bacterium]